jgi:Transposase DDE domain
MIDELIKQARKGFGAIKDHRKPNAIHPLVDLLSAGFAVFSLKDPSLLSFRHQFPRRSENLKRVYGIEQIPEDTALREGIDGVDPASLQQQFKPFIDLLRQKEVLKKRQVLGGYTVLAGDGTEHYCSGNIACPHCLTKNHRNGSVSYHHQMLGAVLVSSGEKTVFPVAVEPIVRQDGREKNDCELNAAKRLVPQIRQAMPTDKLLIALDALYANAPLIRLLKEHQIAFVIGIKDGFPLVQADRLAAEGKLREVSWEANGRLCAVRFANGLILNGQNQDLRVNFLEYIEVDPSNGKLLFVNTWITDLNIDRQNARELVAVARTRWKIENETFNTLKNQGYHLEHNYGHGKKHLATNFAILTFLAFLTDQIAQCLDTAFQKALAVCQSKRALWEKVRQVFDLLPALSMNAIYRFIALNRQIDHPLLI